MAKLLGIDVGSTTVKVAVLGEDGKTEYSSYVRHLSRVGECVRAELNKVRTLSDKFRACITGSAGLGIAERGKISFVQTLTRLAWTMTRSAGRAPPATADSWALTSHRGCLQK